MFEIIYISPSCKQAANFTNDLAIKLKQCGIGGFDIDRENIQLKSDKFVVSAVSIFGNNLGFSHHMVKYYIDKAANADYTCERARENDMETLKCLRCSFREDTKEISEEELIDILMEVCR